MTVQRTLQILAIAIAALLLSAASPTESDPSKESFLRSLKTFAKAKEGSQKHAKALQNLLELSSSSPANQLLFGSTDKKKNEKHFKRGSERLLASLAERSPSVAIAAMHNLYGVLQHNVHTCAAPAGSGSGDPSLHCAELAFKKSLESNLKSNSTARLNLADVLISQGKLGEAEDILRALTPDEYGPYELHAREDLCWAVSNPSSAHAIPLDQYPRRIAGGEPSFSDAARSEKIQGVVILHALLSPEGQVVCVRPVKGLPHGLTAAAISSAKQWRFDPTSLKQGDLFTTFFTVNFDWR